MSVDPKSVELAMELLKLGVSQAGVADLLGYPHEVIERQLLYLPHRKVRRPAAFIVEAIRNDYSPPNTYSHAQNPRQLRSPRPAVDEDAQLPAGPPASLP